MESNEKISRELIEYAVKILDNCSKHIWNMLKDKVSNILFNDHGTDEEKMSMISVENSNLENSI